MRGQRAPLAARPLETLEQSRCRMAERVRLQVTDQPGRAVERFQRAAGPVLAKSQRQHVVEEDDGQVARPADDVGNVRLLRQRPQRAAAPVHGEQPDDRVGAELEILSAHEEHRGNIARRR